MFFVFGYLLHKVMKEAVQKYLHYQLFNVGKYLMQKEGIGNL